MDKRWFLAGFIVLLVSNGIILLTVTYNHSNQIDNLIFSERELRKYSISSHEENSTISLQLVWRTPALDKDSYKHIKVTKDVLNSFKFHKNKCARGFREERKVWLLMEFSGQAYQQDINNLKEKLKTAEKEENNTKGGIKTKDAKNSLYILENTGTRLYVVDVNIERDALIQRIKPGDGKFVAKGVVGEGYTCDELVEVKRLFIDLLHVSNDLLPINEDLPKKYHAVIAVGMLGHAWLKAITTR